MESQTVFAALRDALATLYSEPQNARVIVADAGLDLTRVRFDARSQTNWHNILTEALHQDRLGQLLVVAQDAYPSNAALDHACAAYARLLAQGGQLESPVSLPDDRMDQTTATSGGAVLNRDVNLAQGDFVGHDKHDRAIRIDGDASGSVLITGDNNQVFVGHDERCQSAKHDSPFMAESLPDDHVQRATEFNQLIAYLLAGTEKTVAIMATILGAGGFGKTTLAQAICHDKRIRAAFPDGILWTTVGDDKANVLLGLRKLYRALTHQEAQFVDQHDAAIQLSKELADRRCLIVIDDVWNAAHLQPFLEGGARCARLVTTRIASVVPKDAEVVALDAMQVSEATALLGAGLGHADYTALATLARRLGEWPLLLKLVNRRLYEDVEQYDRNLAAAIAQVREELDEFGLTAFDVNDAEERSQAVAASMGISLRHLKSDAQYGRTLVDEAARFFELAIFPEDTAIPLSTLAILWQQTGALSIAATERLCRRLADLSLILRYDGHAATILLHDVTRHFLLSQAVTAQLCIWHNALLAGYRAQCDGEWWRLPDDGYLYQQLLWHLQHAQQQDALETLLFTYSWLDAKLQATDIVSLIRDFDFRRDKQRYSQLSLLRHALQMSVSVLARDKDQLVSQLYGRLGGLKGNWQPFVAAMAKQKRTAWLRLKSPGLVAPGGNLIYTLSGHTDGVSNLLLTPDGRLLSSCRSSSDHTVKLWDLEQGVLLHSLEGHTAGVSNLLLTPDGRLLSSCSSNYSSRIGRSDHTVKVWDLEQGVLLHSLKGHTAGVSNLLLTPDGHLLSSCGRNSRSDDHTVKVWDLERGMLLHSLEGHTASVSNLLLTPDGHLLSSCDSGSDYTVKVWDLERGMLLHSLEGHTAGVSNLLLTPDGRLLSSCGSGSSTRSIWDHTIKVWDLEQGVLLHSLEGHTIGVDNLVLTPDGRLLSSCGSVSRYFASIGSDHTVKVWDLEQGVLLHSLEEHMDGVDNLMLTPDGHLLSSCSIAFSSDRSSWDHTVKVWDLERGMLLHSLEGHTAGVSNLLLTPNGHLLSSCDSGSDYTVKVWDLERGVLLHSLEGHTAGVDNLLLTPDGHLLSSSHRGSDYTVKVWDLERGVLLHSLYGHTDGVDNLVLTPDGHLLSACSTGSDHTIKVWDLEQGVLLHSPEGHTDGVSNLLLTPDGRLLSSCRSGSDHTIKVWDLEQGVLLHSLEGHTAGVNNLLLTPDGRLLSSGHSYSNDHTVKVWDLEQGVLLHSLEGHTAGVNNLLLTPDGRLLSSCSSNYSSRIGRSDHTVKVWDLEQGVLLHSLEGHTAGVNNLLLTPDGRLLSSCSSDIIGISSDDNTIKVWDMERGVLLHSLYGHMDGISNLLLTSDGRLLSSCSISNSGFNSISDDNTIKVWDLEQGVLLHSLEGHTDGVNNLLLTPDGHLLSSCSSDRISSDHTIKVWDLEQGVLLHSLEGHTDGVSNLLLTSDGHLLSSCGSSSDDHMVKVWDIKRGVLLHSLEGHTAGVSNLLLTLDGRLLSSCGSNSSGDDHTVKVWDLDQGAQLHSLEGDAPSIRHTFLSKVPDYLIATAGNQLTIWNFDCGKKVAQFTADGVILSCKEADNGTIVIGGGLGVVHFLRLVIP